MTLPKIDTPVFDLTLPLSKKKIKYRPFLVKEQKNLLMAMESGDRESIEQNVQQVLNNCTLTKGIDIDKLPVLDIEYYFIHLRARSVGEVVENKYRCENEVEDKTCGNIMETSVNLLELKVTDIPKGDGVIQLTSTISIKLGYPKFSVLNKISEVQTGTEIAFRMIADSVEYIYDDKEQQFYYASELKQEEIIEFIESLSQQQYEKIEQFFANLPKLQKKIEMKCSRCGFEHKIDVEGLESFRLIFGHGNLRNYYKTNFSLMQHHKYSLTELENMIPWERDIYLAMLIQFIEEENQKLKQRQNERKIR